MSFHIPNGFYVSSIQTPSYYVASQPIQHTSSFSNYSHPGHSVFDPYVSRNYDGKYPNIKSSPTWFGPTAIPVSQWVQTHGK